MQRPAPSSSETLQGPTAPASPSGAMAWGTSAPLPRPHFSHRKKTLMGSLAPRSFREGTCRWLVREK